MEQLKNPKRKTNDEIESVTMKPKLAPRPPFLPAPHAIWRLVRFSLRPVHRPRHAYMTGGHLEPMESLKRFVDRKIRNKTR